MSQLRGAVTSYDSLFGLDRQQGISRGSKHSDEYNCEYVRIGVWQIFRYLNSHPSVFSFWGKLPLRCMNTTLMEHDRTVYMENMHPQFG